MKPFYRIKNGADLLELCSNLEQSGLTPSREFIKSVQNHINLPLKIMIRPKARSFEYNIEDIKKIKSNIRMALDLEIQEIAFGALKGKNKDYHS